MNQNQIRILQETGEAHLKAAAQCQNVQDVEVFTKLGLECFAQAREIFRQLQSNSVLLFLEYCYRKGRAGELFDAYLTFCVRNSLHTVSEEDFTRIASEILNAETSTG